MRLVGMGNQMNQTPAQTLIEVTAVICGAVALGVAGGLVLTHGME